MLDEASGGDQYIVAMGKVDDLFDGFPRHERKRATGKFECVYIFAHCFQYIFQVALSHWCVVGTSDLGDAALTWFAFALIRSQVCKSSLVLAHVSLSF